jgi:hypothetical protein
MLIRRQLRYNIIIPALVILTGILCFHHGAWAGATKLPADIDSGLGYLYEFADPQTTMPLEVERLDNLMAFIQTPKNEGASSAGHSGAFLDPLAYHEFTVKRSLPFILGYAHNSGIPPHFLTLATLRYASWKEFSANHPDVPNITARLENLETPVVIRGMEHEEIAPDPSSGAYYSYDLQRTLIGFRHGPHTVWLSMSRQNDKSDVGRKGYVLDAENAWHYIYTGEKGITKTGLGWVDSYMYDGFSCNFFIQSDEAPDQVKVAIFKYLRAGWNDMNFVKYKHISEGLERFGVVMRQILENPDLPPPAEIEAVQRRIGDLPEDQLRQMNRAYLLALEKQYGKKGAFPRSWFKKHVIKGDYVDQLKRPQLESVVFLEYMNGVLGMHPATKPESLLGYLKVAEP